MKKILFNDKFGLTQAVLDGRKTMTRRICPFTLHEGNIRDELTEVFPDRIYLDVDVWMFSYRGKEYRLPKENYPKYKVGEVVAIAQRYKDIADGTLWDDFREFEGIEPTKHAGWNNKLFVRPEYMKRYIRITNVKIERLQAISNEECLREGVVFSKERYEYDGTKSYFVQGIARTGSRWNRMFCKHFDTPRQAFAALIDKVSGKIVWESNPWVFAYEFELID